MNAELYLSSLEGVYDSGWVDGGSVREGPLSGGQATSQHGLSTQVTLSITHSPLHKTILLNKITGKVASQSDYHI